MASDEHLSGRFGYSPLARAWRKFRDDRLAMLGIGLLLLWILIAIFGQLLIAFNPAFDPSSVRLTERFKLPFAEVGVSLAEDLRPFAGIYWLGTDALGRDLLSRMLQGASISLTIGLLAVAIAAVIGILLGGIAGYWGEKRLGLLSVDQLIMRFTDAVLCFPTFFLILTVIALLPSSIYNIMIVIGITSWMPTARLVRAEILSLRERDYVLAARSMNFSNSRILFVHILPNAMAPVFVTATISIAGAILTESALSFLGFGVQPPQATWGNILADGRAYLFDAPWLFFIPALAILTVVLAFNLVGEGLREALNPKLMSGIRARS